jgi:hypothetical protein
MNEANTELQIAVPGYQRTIRRRPVSFTCATCGRTVTQWRFPSPTPSYCSEPCRTEARRRSIRESVRRHREAKRRAAEHHP